MLPRIESIGFASATAVFFDISALLLIGITALVKYTSGGEQYEHAQLLDAGIDHGAALHADAAGVPLIIRLFWTFGIIKFFFAGHESFLMIGAELPNPRKEYAGIAPLLSHTPTFASLACQCRLRLTRDSSHDWHYRLGRILPGCSLQLIRIHLSVPGSQPCWSHSPPLRWKATRLC